METTKVHRGRGADGPVYPDDGDEPRTPLHVLSYFYDSSDKDQHGIMMSSSSVLEWEWRRKSYS